jgi:hypothetical protein
VDCLDAYGVKGPIQDCICLLYVQVAVDVTRERLGVVWVPVDVRQGYPLSPTLLGMFRH